MAAFGALGAWSAYAALYDPGLQLPTSSQFQLFRSSDPMELYDMVYKQHFTMGSGASAFGLPIYVYFGMRPQDNGAHLDPYSRGHPVYAPLDLASSAAQLWVEQFFAEIQAQPFASRQLASAACPICGMLAEARLPCAGGANFTGAASRLSAASRCCGLPAGGTMPNATQLDACLVEYAQRLESGDIWFGTPPLASPAAAGGTAVRMRVMRLRLRATMPFTMKFNEMDQFR